jgi:broad specificity phosphatase PhoE
VLARHGEPALSRKVKLTARQYRDWWALYEAGGILAGQVPPAHLKGVAARAGVILTSTRRRSIETAQALAEGREFTHDEVFIEAPLPPPPWPDFIRLSPKTWGVISRISWWLGGHGGQETRPDAQKRAVAAARRLHELALRGEDVLVVAHGFFNTMIGMELRRLGWRKVRGRGWRYWSTRYYER